MITEIIRKLTEMRLFTMSSKLQELSQTARLNTIEPLELMTILTDSEYDKRRTNKIKRLQRQAKVKMSSACVQDIHYSAKKNLNKDKLYDIITGKFLDHCNNILISGKTGVGKSYLACAFANLACVNGHPARYYRIPKFLEYLNAEVACGNYLKVIEQVGKIKVLVLDDLGPDVMTKTQRNFFMEVIEERYLRNPTIIASQLPLEQWYDIFGDKTIADAICDRIFHNAYKIVLKGDSLRKKKSPELETVLSDVPEELS